MQTEYDVVIIGGGVQGCGIAQACAAAGFSTLIIDKKDWGAETSSKSSKLIHGGLRYIQTAQFSLVRESLAEREWLFSHAPDLVKPNWFYLPLYKDNRFRPWQLATGLSLYQMLGGLNKHSFYKRIPKRQWKELAGLKTEGLQAVFAYQDGQTSDKALTERIVASAKKLGADCVAPAQFTRAAKFSNGYQACFRTNEGEFCVKTRLLINASGPWTNHVLACITPAPGLKAIDLIQGTHIVIDQQISEHCFYLEVPSDKRVIFVMPWQDKTLIGTTETLFEGHPDNCQPLDREIYYLQEALQHYFPSLQYQVIDSFAGLRVLPKSEGRAFSRPRDTIIEQQGNLISVYGGKLTTWRATAEQVLRRVGDILAKNTQVDTRRIPL